MISHQAEKPCPGSPGVSSRLAAMRTAWKRAKHFAPAFDGPFTAYRSPIGNNYARMIDNADDSLDELWMLHYFAEGLNHEAQAQMVKDNQDLCAAFGSFASRMPFDPVLMPDRP